LRVARPLSCAFNAPRHAPLAIEAQSATIPSASHRVAFELLSDPGHPATAQGHPHENDDEQYACATDMRKVLQLFAA
jgi:hypothetical protein